MRAPTEKWDTLHASVPGMSQTQVLSIRLTLEEVAALTSVARCPCCKQRITKPTTAAQAIIRAALGPGPTPDPEDE